MVDAVAFASAAAAIVAAAAAVALNVPEHFNTRWTKYSPPCLL